MNMLLEHRYRPNFIEISPLQETLQTLRKIYFTGFRQDGQDDGIFHNHSREYGYDLKSSFLTGYVLEDIDGGIVCRHLVRRREYEVRHHSGEWLVEWSDLARNMLTGKYPSMQWSQTGPQIAKEAITFKKDKYIDFPSDRIATIETNKIPWMFTSSASDPEYIGFKDPNLFFYLASSFYIREEDNSKILGKLAQDNLLSKEVRVRTVPLLSFIAEHILVHRPNEFHSFVSDLIDRIGGEEGFETASAVIEDLESISPINPVHEWKQEQSDTLSATWDALPEKYALWRYQNREAVIPYDILEGAFPNSSFWETLFVQTGIKELIEEKFGSEELRPVLETALRERKIIPGLILIFSHILGYDADTARHLAAASLMGWGVIVSYDDLADGHMMRKGAATDVALSGFPLALDRTMLALAKVLQTTLTIDSDRLLIEKFLTMLESSCRGNWHARRLNWDDDMFWFINEMNSLVSAFSWFPEFIGRRTNLGEAGGAFGSFLSGVHTIGQMNNDIEDIEENLVKHERGSDIGKRITLFWKTLVELPDEVITREEKQLVRSAWEVESQSDIVTILKIGMRYRTAVVRALYSHIKELYDQAKIMLEKGFQNVPLLDTTNVTYRKILLASLEQEWEKFCRFSEIEEAKPTEV